MLIALASNKIPSPNPQKDLFEGEPNQELPYLVEHGFPTEISRRNALNIFPGFDKDASRKFLGTLAHFLRDTKLIAFFDNSST